MPRVKRRHAVGVVVHVIVRFVDGRYTMDEVQGARDEYLRRLDRAVRKSDWTLCWYALMGTHVHLGMVSGEAPFDSWARGLHSGWANWVNRTQRRRDGRSRGPVLADRPQTLVVPDHHASRLAAYIHNNPVRAAVVAQPEESTWTSHCAYLGHAPAIPALDVERGLSLFGTVPSAEGRIRFHEFVRLRRDDPRDAELSGGGLRRARSEARQLLGSGAELMTPHVAPGRRARFPVHIVRECRDRPRYAHSATAFVEWAERQLEVPRGALSARRTREVSRLRSVVVLSWRLLGRRMVEVCAALGVSRPAGSIMLARAGADELAVAHRLLARLQQLKLLNSVP